MNNNKKRQMWVQFCCLWAVIWGLLGLFIWILLPMAALSLLMILLPVGVSPDEVPVKHDPDAWRTDVNRPWNKK